MAPEILVAGHLSKAADVYAFGILVFEMFSGKRAFDGLNLQQVVHSVGTQNKRPIFPPGVSVKIVELACKCWGQASDRPTFEDICRDLQVLAKEDLGGALSKRRCASPSNASDSHLNSSESISTNRESSIIDFRALQMGGGVTSNVSRNRSFNKSRPSKALMSRNKSSNLIRSRSTLQTSENIDDVEVEARPK
jgi:hypothetical protein